jgi:hypothetical protein
MRLPDLDGLAAMLAGDVVRLVHAAPPSHALGRLTRNGISGDGVGSPLVGCAPCENAK